MNNIDKVIKYIKKNTQVTKVLLNESMSKYTSFKTGGNADIIIESSSILELANIIKFLNLEQIKYLVLGHCTNVLISDNGIKDIVIRVNDNLSNIFFDDDYLVAEAGALISDIAIYTRDNSLSGFEYACGIPGTIGGAVYMNAGAYGDEIKDHIVEVEIIDTEGKIRVLTKDELKMGYRKTIVQEIGGIIVKTKFLCTKGDINEIMKNMKDFTYQREEKQPLEYSSAGSIFKRPKGYFTGKLIQDANLMGYTIGGAQVSKKHAGFIINTGNAKSKDIYNLIQYIQKNVYDLTNVELETEVKIIGNFKTKN